MPGSFSGLRDPGDHPVDVTTVDRLAGDGSQHQRPVCPVAAAGLQSAQHGDGHRANAAIIDQLRVPTLDFTTGHATTRFYPRANVVDMALFIEGVSEQGSVVGPRHPLCVEADGM